MGPREAPQDELEAWEAGRAFLDLSAQRKVRVTGADARAWLHDLVTSDVASLEPGGSQRSLLLTPTGRIRADLEIAMDGDGYVLLQAPEQPDHVAVLLGKYVLSSDVVLDDVTATMPWFALSGDDESFAAGPADALVARGLLKVGPDTAEVWRIRRGIPRMCVDFEQDALPAEAGLDWTIDTAKGCFLGQESVARVRNLGHPPTVLRHVLGPRALQTGSPVHAGDPARDPAGDPPVGEVTSAAVADGGGTVAIVRLRWEAAAGPWTTPEGVALDLIGPKD
jgi:tRNA-modifying protein YgfZ